MGIGGVIMRLYIIRHGDPDYEKGTITEHGHKEAEALSKRLASYGIDKIYSSPMNRAIHTMDYTKNLLKIEPTVHDWMEELQWVDKNTGSPWNVPGEIILNQGSFPSHENWHHLSEYKGLDLKDKFETLKMNSDNFIEGLGYKRDGQKYKCLQHNEDSIAIFCHGGFGLAWLSHLLNIPLTLVWAGFWLAPSSVTTVIFEKRSEDYAVPRCLGLGDTSHLYEAGLPIRSRGILANYY